MITSIPVNQIEALVVKQLSNYFPISTEEKQFIHSEFASVLERLERCFIPNSNKYYIRNGEAYFNPFHSGQYNIFLYFLSNNVWKSGHAFLADKIYYLNKIMNSDDLFYEIELPDIFALDHPVGSVMGRAKYSNGFSFSQGCTVGNNHGIYPVVGNNVQMCGNTSIIGKCCIGNNVTLGFGAVVKDQDVPDNSLVFGQSPNLIIKPKKVR